MKYPLHQVRNNLYHYSAKLRRQIFRNVYGMSIGTNTRIARSAKLDKTNPKGVHIGNNTSIAFNVNVLTHDFVNRRHVDTFIGNNCFIGGGATILAGVTIGDHCIIGAGSVVMNDIPSNSIAAGNPARLIRTGIMTSEYGILEEESLETSSKFGELRAFPEASTKQSRDVLTFIRSELGVGSDVLYKPVQDTPVDSFSLITLRTALEAKFGIEIPDLEWVAAGTLAEISQMPCLGVSQERQALDNAQPASLNSDKLALSTDIPGPMVADKRAESGSHPLTIVRTGRAAAIFEVEMPQMALSGLSEAWMLKEIGNVHWKLISNFLQSASSQIKDQSGERLYATFTRIKWECGGDLQDFHENDHLHVDARLSRYGASFYFSDQSLRAGPRVITAHAMSTFAKHGERGTNTSLVKGAPVLVQPTAIPAFDELPEFGKEYRHQRAAESGEVIFECEYEIMGPHDINGVGLLYFAAYPMIFDICTEKFEGKGFLRSHSSASKDLMYFANAEPDETLIFRIHERSATETVVTHFATLSRKSDGKRMAQVRSEKRKPAV